MLKSKTWKGKEETWESYCKERPPTIIDSFHLNIPVVCVVSLLKPADVAPFLRSLKFEKVR